MMGHMQTLTQDQIDSMLEDVEAIAENPFSSLLDQLTAVVALVRIDQDELRKELTATNEDLDTVYDAMFYAPEEQECAESCVDEPPPKVVRDGDAVTLNLTLTEAQRLKALVDTRTFDYRFGGMFNKAAVYYGDSDAGCSAYEAGRVGNQQFKVLD